MKYKVLLSFDDRPLSRARLRRLLNKLTERIINNMIKKNAYVTGKTASMIHIEREDGRIRLLVPEYFPTLETGRAPGRIPIDFEQRINEWMKNKGIRAPKPSTNHSYAENIVWSIYHYGSRRNKPFRDIYSSEITKFQKRNLSFLAKNDMHRFLYNVKWH